MSREIQLKRSILFSRWSISLSLLCAFNMAILNNIDGLPYFFSHIVPLVFYFFPMIGLILGIFGRKNALGSAEKNWSLAGIILNSVCMAIELFFVFIGLMST